MSQFCVPRDNLSLRKDCKSASKASLPAQMRDTIVRHQTTTSAAVLQASATVEVLSIAVNGTIIPMIIDDTQAVIPNLSWNGESDKGFIVRSISAVKMPITLDNHAIQKMTTSPVITAMSANGHKRDCTSPKSKWSSEEFFEHFFEFRNTAGLIRRRFRGWGRMSK